MLFLLLSVVGFKVHTSKQLLRLLVLPLLLLTFTSIQTTAQLSSPPPTNIQATPHPGTAFVTFALPNIPASTKTLSYVQVTSVQSESGSAGESSGSRFGDVCVHSYSEYLNIIFVVPMVLVLLVISLLLLIRFKKDIVSSSSIKTRAALCRPKTKTFSQQSTFFFGKTFRVTIFSLLSVSIVSGQSMAENDITDTCFNFEISKRTESAVRKFLKFPELVNKMTDQAYNVGSVKVYDVPSVRKWEFTQLLSFETLYMVYAGFETGFFTGYIRNVNENTGVNSYKYTERTGTDNTLPSAVRKYWHANARTGDISPNGLGIIRNRTYDHRSREWYKEAKTAGKTMWSSIYRFASSNELGLTHCQPIYDIDHSGHGTSDRDENHEKFSGVLAVDYTLGNINRFLSTAFSNSTSSVILVEHDTGLLVASSRQGGLLLVVENDEELPTRVKAWNSTDEMIKTVSKILQKDKDGWSERLIKKDGYFIEVTNFKADNLNWDILVAMPASDTGDEILVVGSTLYTLFIIAIFIGVISLVIVVTIMIFQREKNIWKAASPMFLITFACGCICWNLSSLLFLFSPTATSCMSRTWAFNVTYIFVFAVLFVKVQRMNTLYLKFKKKMPTVKHMEPKQFLKGISSIVFVEILLQMLWSVIDPNQVVVFHSQQQSISTTAITETLFCRSKTITFPMIAMTSKLIFILWGYVVKILF